MKFKRKAVVISAVQLTQENVVEICEFAKVGRLTDGDPQMGISNGKLELFIPTSHSTLRAEENDWIIKDLDGQLYPVNPKLFEESYETTQE